MKAGHHLPDVSEARTLFPISTVSDATGVPAVTLRAWERRYGFLQPHRSANGHRAYSVEQIDLIRRVTALIDAGIPVGRVGDLIRGEADAGDDSPAGTGPDWQAAQDDMVAAICAFDEVRLDNLYEGLLSRFSDARITTELVLPLLRRLGTGWASGDTGVAEEHFFSVYIRNKLGSRWQHGQRPLAGRRIVVTCMPGERHEYGLLFFGLVARSRGLDPLVLGADMPAGELIGVVAKTRAAGVVLSSIVEPGWQIIERDIRNLVAELDVPVFAGGSGVATLGATLQSVGAIPVGTDYVDATETIFRRISGGG